MYGVGGTKYGTAQRQWEIQQVVMGARGII